MNTKKFLTAAFCFLTVIAHCQTTWTDSRPGGTSSIHNFNYYSYNNALSGQFTNFNNIENTKGKRYLFDNWVKGKVINAQGALVVNDSFSYNLDKVQNDLIVKNGSQVIIVDKKELGTFTLSDGNQEYTFERNELINPAQFFVVLAKNEKYALYKLIKTKFIKADYHTNGLSESGNTYDEYKDEADYYIVSIVEKKFQQFSLKKKSIKTAFESISNNSKEYFEQHKNDAIDEEFLKKLVVYLNKSLPLIAK